jgi:hypothetical protein
MRNYKLFLDDERSPRDIYPTTNNSEWVIVRSYNEFVRVIERDGLPFQISFDHDLSFEHYPNRETEGQPIDYSQHTEKTGYACAMWLIDYCLRNGILELPACSVHSANPVGRRNIEQLLSSWDRIKHIHIK